MALPPSRRVAKLAEKNSKRISHRLEQMTQIRFCSFLICVIRGNPWLNLLGSFFCVLAT